jgi:hypothetical protein
LNGASIFFAGFEVNNFKEYIEKLFCHMIQLKIFENIWLIEKKFRILVPLNFVRYIRRLRPYLRVSGIYKVYSFINV